MRNEHEGIEGDEASPLGGVEAGLRERWLEEKSNLYSHALDFSLSTLVSLVQDNELNLDPEYSRRYRWDVVRKSRLIESFLLEVPVPPSFFPKTSTADTPSLTESSGFPVLLTSFRVNFD